MSEINYLFKEEQRMKQKWLWILIIVISFFLLFVIVYSLYKQLYMGEPFGNNPVSNGWLLIISLILLIFAAGLPLLFYFSKLVTTVSDQELTIKFFPFLKRRFEIKNIADTQIIKYEPIREYGGWGIRLSIRGNGWAFTVSGNSGVRIELQNGRKYLIGSQKPAELDQAIRYAITKS